MRRLSRLYWALDQTTSTNAKVEALAAYFAEAPAEDAIWAVAMLRGDRPKRPVKTTDLRVWAAELAGIPPWLMEQCYATVGDLAETLNLVVPAPETSTDDTPLRVWCEERIPSLRSMDESTQRATVCAWWCALAARERFVLNKLITGGLRVGVSKGLVERALARHAGIPRDTITHRLMGAWPRAAAFYETLIAEDGGEARLAQPYPFYLASPIPSPPSELGAPEAWAFEWKWDGIRGQLIRREGQTFLWSRGEELVNDAFPDVLEAAAALPDGTALDGELLAVDPSGAPLPFRALQRRLQRKKPGKKILSDVPVIFRAYDLMEIDGEDIRAQPMRARRAALEALLDDSAAALHLSELLTCATWEDAARLRARAQQEGVEGLMVKRWESTYRSGRKRGDWWKWKVDPYLVDAVLLYAQAGHGRRSSLFTDYTFGVWRDGELVTFAKAYSGLSDAEIRELDAWIKANTIERFGPVRSVPRVQVFELAFEGIARSSRHKSGVAVRFPRIKRWRRDKPAEEADSLRSLEALIDARSAGSSS